MPYFVHNIHMLAWFNKVHKVLKYLYPTAALSCRMLFRIRTFQFQMAPLRIAVIGAGIVGLSTAVQIQEALPSSQVTIIAEKFDIDTTSDGAAGTFQPASNLVAGVSRDVLK